MPSKDTKTLVFNQYKKSDKEPFAIYADLQCLIEKIDSCKSNPENSYTIEIDEHIPSGFSTSTILKAQEISIICIEVKIVKKLCESFKEHAMKIINFGKKNNEVNNK